MIEAISLLYFHSNFLVILGHSFFWSTSVTLLCLLCPLNFHSLPIKQLKSASLKKFIFGLPGIPSVTTDFRIQVPLISWFTAPTLDELHAEMQTAKLIITIK